MPSTLRFILAAALIAATGGLLQARGRHEIIPNRAPLKTFPAQLGPWSSEDIPIEKEVLDVLGPGSFLLREYTPDASNANAAHADDPNINLFIAYFPSQRAGDTIHSPKHCLPGAGWLPIDSSRVTLSLPGHEPFPTNRYVIARGGARELVMYWYWAHDRGVASEYWAKFYLVADSIRMNRSDGALVRITTDMYPGESADAAQQRIMPFANEIAPQLDTYIPR